MNFKEKRIKYLMIGFLMFVVPEVIWSPVTKIFSGFFFRNSLMDIFSINFVSVNLTIQAIGLVIFLYGLVNFAKLLNGLKKALLILLVILLSLLVMITLFDLWVSLAFRNIGF